MDKERIRLRDFKPDHDSLVEPMYWLSAHDVPNEQVGSIFGKTKNHAAVNACNESIPKPEPFELPEQPDVKLAEPELDLLGTYRDEDMEAKVEAEASKFWAKARALEGIRPLGKLLREINKPGKENIPRLRLKGRLEHLLAEMYLHIGYFKTSLAYSRRALDTRLKLYNDTLNRPELFAHAKTTLLMTCALEVSGQIGPVLPLLDNAEAAFKAANAPVDPELHRQRAATLLRQGNPEAARKEYEAAYEAYPLHRAFMGLEDSDHARFDVGHRPNAILNRDHDEALKNVEIAQAWPDGDIHRSINLNVAIATAFFTDSKDVRKVALDKLPQAWAAAEGYGRQMTTVRLLKLLPKIPKKLRSEWALYALRANAYHKL